MFKKIKESVEFIGLYIESIGEWIPVVFFISLISWVFYNAEGEEILGLLAIFGFWPAFFLFFALCGVPVHNSSAPDDGEITR